MTALIQKLNSHFQLEHNKDITLLLQLLISLLFTFLNEFYLIKFQDYHNVTTQTIISKSVWVFILTMIALNLKANKSIFTKYIFTYLGMILCANFIIPFIARNFTFLELNIRQSIMSFDQDFLLFCSNYVVIGPTLIIWTYVFKQNIVGLMTTIIVSIFATVLSILNPVSESLLLILKSFEIEYSLMTAIQFIFISSIVFPFWFIIIEASTSVKPINFRKVILSFIMLSYALVYLVSTTFGSYSLYHASYALPLLLILSYSTFLLKKKFLEGIFLKGYLKYFLLMISAIGMIESESTIYVMHCVILALFSVFMIKCSYKKPTISRFKEVHCD